MIITISGKPGSGKSAVAEIIAERLKLRHYSMGDLQRKYAREKGITIQELGELESEDREIDKGVDEYQAKLGKKEDNFVIDGRLSFYFIPDSIKIFLECDEKEGAKRIFKDIKAGARTSEEKAGALEDAYRIIIKRENVNRKRFKKYYNADFLDRKNYDLVVDTTNITARQAAGKILDFIANRKV